VILLTSGLYVNQSAKDILMAGEATATAQTTSESEPAARAMTAKEIAVDAAAPAAPAAVDDVVAPAFFPGQQEAMIMASEKACNAGDMEECVTAGLDYSGDNHMDIKVDYSKAEKYYKKACDGGNAGGCARLGIMYDDAGKLPLDHSKAKKYYKKACDGGDNWGCHRLEQGFF
jgi:TPR repeat protein